MLTQQGFYCFWYDLNPYELISKSGRLSRPRCPSGCEGSYLEIYYTALQLTYQFICENIDIFNPEKGTVMAWINFIFSKKFIVATGEIMNLGVGRNWYGIERLSLEAIENIAYFENIEQSDPIQELIQVIREDPEGLFENTKIWDTRVNFKWLVLKRIEGCSWGEISREVGVSIPTLSSFYRRSLEKFRNKIKEYLGY